VFLSAEFSGFSGPEIREPTIGIAEALQLDTHAVHERKVQAAGTPIVVAAVEVIEDAAGLQCAAASTR
jgi:hypothetical protein